jgi:outer membrane protein assembly factor BamE
MNHLPSFRCRVQAIHALFTHTVLPLTLLVTLLISACVYHAPIQQGNLLDAKDIDQISVGMTQAQVRYVLGTPMVADPFSTNRWDYLYYLKRTNMPDAKKQQLVVYFENGNVSKLERTDLSVVRVDPRLKDEDQKLPWYRRWLSKIA